MRQVVWLLTGLLVIGGFLAYTVGILWFGRSTILSLAPSDTILAIELRLNNRTAPFLLDWLAGVPLVSDRSIELKDLADYVHGDLAVFITKNGQRSVGIRTNADTFPNDVLTQFSIAIQKQGPFLLLSSSPTPIAGIKSSIGPRLPSIGKTWIGRVVLPQDDLVGNLFISTTILSLEFNTLNQKPRNNITIPGAAIAIGLPAIAQRATAGGLAGGVERLFAGFPNESLILTPEQDIEIVIKPSDVGLEILLAVDKPDATHTDVIKELEQIGAFARPAITKKTLTDGTELEEILVQPDLASVEEISSSFGVIYRVATAADSSILATIHNSSVLFTNSQRLLESYIQIPQSKKEASCNEYPNRVDFPFLIGETALDHFDKNFGFINGVFDDFSAISFEFKKYSTNVYLCRI